MIAVIAPVGILLGNTNNKSPRALWFLALGLLQFHITCHIINIITASVNTIR